LKNIILYNDKETLKAALCQIRNEILSVERFFGADFASVRLSRAARAIQINKGIEYRVRVCTTGNFFLV
jgi:hypothetical protein